MNLLKGSDSNKILLEKAPSTFTMVVKKLKFRSGELLSECSQCSNQTNKLLHCLSGRASKNFMSGRVRQGRKAYCWNVGAVLIVFAILLFFYPLQCKARTAVESFVPNEHVILVAPNTKKDLVQIKNIFKVKFFFYLVKQSISYHILWMVK
jgi:hypothetical protein